MTLSDSDRALLVDHGARRHVRIPHLDCLACQKFNAHLGRPGLESHAEALEVRVERLEATIRSADFWVESTELPRA